MNMIKIVIFIILIICHVHLTEFNLVLSTRRKIVENYTYDARIWLCLLAARKWVVLAVISELANQRE